ncbi:MAG: hypothetical protein ACRD9R_07445 [Pyrinomonadaceae bacterium]
MELPFQQRVFRLGMYFVSGIIGAGTLIDSVNNSISLPHVYALVLTTILACTWAGIEVMLRIRGQRWVLPGGQKGTIKRLGVWPRLALAGALAILLVPKLVSLVHQKTKDDPAAVPPSQIVSDQPPRFSPISRPSDQNDVQIVGGYLEPRHYFFNDAPETRGFYEVAGINFYVKNYSDKALMLTSIEVDVVGGRDVRLNSGGSRGVEILGKDPDEHSAIIIEPGEVKTVNYENGLHLPGMASFFVRESSNLQPIVLVPYGQRHTIATANNSLWSSALDEEFNKLYGKDLTLKVSLFSNYKKLVKTFDVKLTQGGHSSEEDGVFKHDFFVGDALLQLKQSGGIAATVYARID